MLAQNTRESALRREEFHEALRQWLDETFDNRVGDEDSHAGPAWLWVRHGGACYYLGGTSTRAGVREYLRIVTEAHGDPEWFLTGTVPGVSDRVAVGRDRKVIEGFDFFHHAQRR
jgi:hypothetical protein